MPFTAPPNSPLVTFFNKACEGALKSHLFFSLIEKQKPNADRELGRFKLLRFSCLLRKLVKHMKEEPIVEKLKEMRFEIFKSSIRKFGLSLFVPELGSSKLNSAKGRSKGESLVASAKDFQRNLEFLNFKLTVQHEMELSNFQNVFSPFALKLRKKIRRTIRRTRSASTSPKRSPGESPNSETLRTQTSSSTYPHLITCDGCARTYANCPPNHSTTFYSSSPAPTSNFSSTFSAPFSPPNSPCTSALC